jgi:phosphatidylserine decarboxylase
MAIAKEGFREIAYAAAVLGIAAATAGWFFWPLAIPFILLFGGVLSFFRDPHRSATFLTGELCSPADGTITEVTHLRSYAPLPGEALRIGIFLSIFDVHINRSPCPGVVRSVRHVPGTFLDARHVDSGKKNESNTLVIAPDPPWRGPIVVRQVAGLVARRIICHAGEGTRLTMGERFGLIKFGSRTELIVPMAEGTEITIGVGDKVRAGLTVVARQAVRKSAGGNERAGVHEPHCSVV